MRSGRILLGAAALACAFLAYTSGSSEYGQVLDVSAAQNGVAVNETNFPDDAFRKYVLKNIDIDDSGTLSSGEINGTKYISVNGMNISNLAGVEYFTGLTSLICQNNRLTELDVSSNKALTSLSASGNMLSEINLSRNTKLENLDLGTTSKDGTVYGNELTELDLSKNRSLKNLSCTDNKLKSLDLSGCPKIEIVKCSVNRISKLNTVGCGSLRQLECYSNNLKTLDLKGNPELTGLYCSDNKLTSLDLSSNTKLKTLFCRYNYISRESKLKFYDKAAVTTCDYSLQYYSGYKSYVTDVNMLYSKVITGKPSDIFNISSGITGTPPAEASVKAGGIEFVCRYADGYSFTVKSESPDLVIDGSNRLTAKKAGNYDFTLTVVKGGADGSDIVKKFTVTAVDMQDHTEHEFDWKCDRSADGGHFKECFCGEKTAAEPHVYGSKIYQINDRSGKLYNYRACKFCRYADKLGESTVLKNSASGITAASLDGTIASGLKLAAVPADISEFKDKNALCAYDIYFTDGKTRIPAGCKFKVTIPLPKGADVSGAAVLRKKSDGSFRDMNAEYNAEDNSVSFTASVSGVYAVSAVPSSGGASVREPDINDLIILRDAVSEDETNRDGLTDLNGDGKIDNKDLILLKNKLYGNSDL
ncbi:MAG: hypothetical protein NC395_03515 [Prevotella sp.]|nr:hypothetical protein [Prevotella sp.]